MAVVAASPHLPYKEVRIDGARAMTTASVKIGILGASGYTGAELLRLLGDHPRAEIRALTAERQAGKPIGEVFPQLAVYDLPPLVKVDDVDVGGAGRRVLLPAARDHAGDHQGAAARAQGRRPLGRLPPARPAAVRAAPTATRTRRSSCRSRRSTA